jgi:hypothetical protein
VPAREHLRRLLASTACSGDGAPIGAVTALYLDDTNGEPVWAAVRLDPAGEVRLLPLARSWLLPGGRLLVAVTRGAVEEAPAPDLPVVEPGHEEALLRHYDRVLVPRDRSGTPASRWLVRYDAAPAGDR